MNLKNAKTFQSSITRDGKALRAEKNYGVLQIPNGESFTNFMAPDFTVRENLSVCGFFFKFDVKYSSKIFLQAEPVVYHTQNNNKYTCNLKGLLQTHVNILSLNNSMKDDKKSLMTFKLTRPITQCALPNGFS